MILPYRILRPTPFLHLTADPQIIRFVPHLSFFLVSFFEKLQRRNFHPWQIQIEQNASILVKRNHFSEIDARAMTWRFYISTKYMDELYTLQ